MPALADLVPLRGCAVAPGDLDAAEQALSQALPDDLREFLLVSDGSEWADFPACGIFIHPLEQTLGLRASHERAGPRRLIDVASDGSRERFCLDPATGAIVMLDIVGDEPPVACASTLTELVETLASGWDPFERLA